MPPNVENQASQLLTDVSHELRTPLNAVLGMLELSFDEPLTTALRDYLTTAYQSARRLLLVLDDLVELARARRDELELNSAPFELRKTIDAAIVPLEADARTRGVLLGLHVLSGVPAAVRGDAARLQRVLSVLVSHVLQVSDATPLQVEISVATQTEHSAELAIGITDDVDGRVWPPRNAPLAGDDVMNGSWETGDRLALAIAVEWVAQMHGRVWIDSRRPAQIYCTLRLELADAEELEELRSAAEQPETASAPRRGELTSRPFKVLVVDDTPANVKLVKTILSRRGHHAEVAVNGRQAVDRLRDDSFDVVLMDAQMPAMGGLEAAANIRRLADKAHAEVPIVALTAHAMPDSRRECLAAGMDDYLAKPVSATDLIARVEFYGTLRHAAAPSSALARLGGDEALLDELIRLFRDDAPALLDKMHAGVKAHDKESVALAAHNLRGLAMTFNAAPTVAAALAVERLAGDGDFAGLSLALSELATELAALQNALQLYQRRHT